MIYKVCIIHYVKALLVWNHVETCCLEFTTVLRWSALHTVLCGVDRISKLPIIPLVHSYSSIPNLLAKYPVGETRR